jgi:hypothetical protein
MSTRWGGKQQANAAGYHIELAFIAGECCFDDQSYLQRCLKPIRACPKKIPGQLLQIRSLSVLLRNRLERGDATAFQITVHLGDRDAVISAEAGERLLSVLQRAGLPVVEAPCGGKGTCGKCRVKISWRGRGNLSCLPDGGDGRPGVWPSLAAQPQLA